VTYTASVIRIAWIATLAMVPPSDFDFCGFDSIRFVNMRLESWDGVHEQL
jgi:hypothetical protein